MLKLSTAIIIYGTLFVSRCFIKGRGKELLLVVEALVMTTVYWAITKSGIVLTAVFVTGWSFIIFKKENEVCLATILCGVLTVGLVLTAGWRCLESFEPIVEEHAQEEYELNVVSSGGEFYVVEYYKNGRSIKEELPADKVRLEVIDEGENPRLQTISIISYYRNGEKVFFKRTERFYRLWLSPRSLMKANMDLS